MIRLLWTGLRVPEDPPPAIIEVVHHPSTLVEPLELNETDFEKRVKDSAIAFTSRTAVEMLNAPIDGATSVYAVGAGTAAAISKKFQRSVRSPLIPSVASLSSMMDAAGVSDIVAVTVQDSNNPLVGEFNVQDFAVYTSTFIGVVEQDYDAIVITSPRAARDVAGWNNRATTFVYGVEACSILDGGVPIDDMSTVWDVVCRTLDI